MATWRLNILSSRPAAAICVLHLAHAGHHAEHDAAHAADLRHLLGAGRRDRRDRTCRLRIFSAIALAACSMSMFCAAFSTSETMSPMPRMRLAMRRGMEILERIELLAGADAA